MNRQDQPTGERHPFLEWGLQYDPFSEGTQQTIDDLLDNVGTQECYEAERILNSMERLENEGTVYGDFHPIASLPHITAIDIDIVYSQHWVADLEPLRSIINLTELTLNGGRIQSLEPIESLKNLTSLELDAHEVEDLSPLASLLYLRHLRIYNQDSTGGISDLTPVSELTSLTEIVLHSAFQLEDLTPLSSRENLRHLQIFASNVSDLASLRELANLTYVEVTGSEVQDLTPLASLPHLTQLNVGGNQITDHCIAHHSGAHFGLRLEFVNDVENCSALQAR